MQRNLIGLLVKNFTFLILSLLKLTPQLFLVQLNCVQQYLGQILVTIEKLLILHIVVFMPGLSKWAQTPLGPFRAGPQTLCSKALNLGLTDQIALTDQIGNFWLPPWHLWLLNTKSFYHDPTRTHIFLIKALFH